MKAKIQGIAGVVAGAGAAMMGSLAFAQERLGQPTPGGMGLQQAASPLKHEAHFFHDIILLPIITVISLFVLALLIWVVVRYNKKANPTPAKFSHNTLLEVAWTLIPVLILMFIAIFSFGLLFKYHNMPKPDLTVKAVGYQWNWGYEYPDQKIPEYISNMLPEDEVAKRGLPKDVFRLAATEPMVVPVNKVVRVQVTGADVIHAFALPAFGLKTDAIPGRLNETWFKAEKVGTYYGQCSELCGVDHAFMPIVVKVVSAEEYTKWVAAQPKAAPVKTAAGARGLSPSVTLAGPPDRMIPRGAKARMRSSGA